MENLCVYDWISRCKREKVKPDRRAKFFEDAAAFDAGEDGHFIPQNDDADEDSESLKEKKSKRSTNLYAFLPEHPLSLTHATQCSAPENALVPNFIGIPLPREDHGDRENYCMTILTMFKRWRSPKDLKQENESWDEAFHAHPFMPRQLQLMRNFNLRYECLDAHDDFHAQLRKGEGSFIPSWSSEDAIEVTNELDQEHAMSQDLGPLGVDTIEVSSVIGKDEKAQRVQIDTMNKILCRL